MGSLIFAATHKFVHWMKSWTTPNTRNHLTARNNLLQRIQRRLQLGGRIAKHNKAFALHHIVKWLRKFLREYSQMSKCCGGIFIPFVNVNCFAVTAKHTQLAPRSLNHIAGQCSETLQSAWLDREFDMPRNLPVHTHRPVYLPPLSPKPCSRYGVLSASRELFHLQHQTHL